VFDWVNVRQNVKRFGGYWVCESAIHHSKVWGW